MARKRYKHTLGPLRYNGNLKLRPDDLSPTGAEVVVDWLRIFYAFRDGLDHLEFRIYLDEGQNKASS